MLFSLFRNADTLWAVRYGLARSDIIGCTNIATPLILALIIYTLLGNTNSPLHPTVPAHLRHSSRPNTSYPGLKTGHTRVDFGNFCDQFHMYASELLSHFCFQEQGHLLYTNSQ
jgi:hypothetical protein